VDRNCGTHGKERAVYRVLVGGPKEKDNEEDLGVGGRITLRCTLGRWSSMVQTGFVCLRIGSSG